MNLWNWENKVTYVQQWFYAEGKWLNDIANWLFVMVFWGAFIFFTVTQHLSAFGPVK